MALKSTLKIAKDLIDVMIIKKKGGKELNSSLTQCETKENQTKAIKLTIGV